MPPVSSPPPLTPPTPAAANAPPRPTRAARLRFAGWAVLVVAILGGNLALAAGGGRHEVALAIALWPVVGLAVLGVAGLLATTPPDAIRLGRRSGETIVLLGTVVLTTAVWATFHPALSSDLLRYRLDGEMSLSGASPWATAPEQWRNTTGYFNRTSDPFLDAVTPYAEIKSIYPPGAQALFLAAAKWSAKWPAAWPAPSDGGRPRFLPAAATVIWRGDQGTLVATHAAVLRGAAAAAVMITAGLLLWTLRGMDRSPWYALLYAWSPLVVVESAGQGHVDAVGAMFLAASAATAVRGRLALSAVALAAATAVKPHVAVVAPALVAWAWHAAPATPGRWRRPAVVAAVFGVCAVAAYAPLLLSAENWRGWRQTVDIYAMSWEANGSIYELICAPFRAGDGRALADAKIAARLLGGVAAFVSLYLVMRCRLPPVDAAYWLTLVPLLFAPAVYPWYLMWGLAVTPLLRRTGGWTLLTWAATSGLSYQLVNEPVWRLPAGWTLAQYVPVYAALAWELAGLRRPAADAALTAPVR